MTWYKKILHYISILFNSISVMIVCIFTFSSIVLYNLANWVLDTWGLLTMDEIVFHLKVPLEGTNEDMIWDAVNTCAPTAIILLITVVVIYIAIWRKKWLRHSYSALVIILSIIIMRNAAVNVYEELDVEEYLASQKDQSTFIQDNYVDPRTVQIAFPEQKRNLIYIYLESMESTFASLQDGGAYEQNYIPELTELARSNISFSNTDRLGGAHATTGTTWTMGAMFAQTSGLPLNIPIQGLTMDTQEEFLPDIVSLGDILEGQGYQQVLFIGSEAKFAGRDKYFIQHGNYEMWDLNTAREQGKIPEDYFVWWGFEDAKLYEYAKEKLTQMSQNPEPFNFTMLTVDTHFEDGYVCQLCQEQFGEQYANVYACASRQVAEFISWIQQQPFYANTTIVLAGDHLTMDNDFCNNLPEGSYRRVYNAFINSAVLPVSTQNREFTTMDMFPSTLASIGANIEGNRLGLGTNLFSEEQTLTEIYGIQKENDELKRKSSFFDNFTNYIDVDKAKESESWQGE